MNWLLPRKCLIALAALSAAAGGPAPAAAQEAAAAPTEAFVSGFFRFDYDSFGLQLWAGATHQVGGMQILTDVYVTNSFGEMDFGPQVQLGSVTLILTVGPVFDFTSQDVVGLVAPLLTTIYDSPSLYFESWLEMTFGSTFVDGAEDLFHTRNFALYKVNPTLWIGPQVEVNYGFTQADKITSLPVGGQISLGYGKESRLSVFLGYETEEPIDPTTGEATDSDRLAGRFTFVRVW
ncbi:MAG TPA: hypothetical protein VK698_35445 [Kofleriaceae bacterium]|nr:hypothetical protein [Kofleriaceae bacterium]